MPIPDDTGGDISRLFRKSRVDLLEIAGSTLTIAARHHGRLLAFAQSCTVTIPAGLPDGFSCGWSQDGVGSLAFVADGVSLQSLYDLRESAGQYAIGGIVMMDSDCLPSDRRARLVGGGSKVPNPRVRITGSDV